MAIQVMSAVWQHSKAKSGDLLVALAIADFSNDKGLAFPAIPTLARKARLSPRQVKRAIDRLQGLGELVVLKNKGPHAVNLYRIVLGDKLSLGQDVMVTSATVGGDICDQQGVTPMSPNPSVESSKNRHSLSANGFEAFRNAYPRKQGMSEAEKCWCKLNPTHDLVSKIHTAIEQSKISDQWTRDGGRFIPSPAKWLLERRWEDNLPARSIMNGTSASTCCWSVPYGNTMRPCGEPIAPNQGSKPRAACATHLPLRLRLDRKIGLLSEEPSLTPGQIGHPKKDNVPSTQQGGSRDNERDCESCQ